MSLDAGVAATRARDVLTKQLREQFPYMRTSDLEDVIESAVTSLIHGIITNEPIMEQTKSRIGFMSLSAELRNQVYDLALGPELKGNFASRRLKMGLCRVSRQVGQEASSLWYGTRTFLADVRALDGLRLRNWAQGLGISRAAKIFKLVLQVSDIAAFFRFVDGVLYDRHKDAKLAGAKDQAKALQTRGMFSALLAKGRKTRYLASAGP